MSLLPPGYVVRREGNVLTCVCPSVCPQAEGGTPRYLPPSQVSMGGGGTPRYLSPAARSGWEGVPPRYLPPQSQVRMGGGSTPRYLPLQPRIYYTAGGMPLAFTWEDFLVFICIFSLDVILLYCIRLGITCQFYRVISNTRFQFLLFMT